jgi:hypothetical protein
LTPPKLAVSDYCLHHLSSTIAFGFDAWIGQEGFC